MSSAFFLIREGILVEIIVYIFHDGLVVIGKSQHKKCRKHKARDDILLPPIEVAINIGGGPDHNIFHILEVSPWRSMNCSFQGIHLPETTMNAVKVSCKDNVRCA